MIVWHRFSGMQTTARGGNLKKWYRIEFFIEEFMTCDPSAENVHRVYMVERQYTGISRAWAAANRIAASRPNVFFIRVKRL